METRPSAEEENQSLKKPEAGKFLFPWKLILLNEMVTLFNYEQE